jgi:prepilin-type N-terminal cleavage/methylation domain-containing protein
VFRHHAGFTLIEVLIAIALLAAIAIGVVHLLGIGVAAGRDARFHTSTTILAAAKLEELRSLVWSFARAPGPAAPRSDTSTDLSAAFPSSTGPGLSASPPGTLAANVAPYVDYLDHQGRWIGNGPAPPAGAVFIRRWSIVPLPADPARAVILSVLVTTVAEGRARSAPWTRRAGQDALLVVLNTRKGT